MFNKDFIPAPCDNVSHPMHYSSTNGLEVIDVIEAFTEELRGVEATDTGNIIKYICRWKKKNGIEDLKKARWYINHLIDHIDNTTIDEKLYEHQTYKTNIQEDK